MTKIMKWVCSGMMFLSFTACGTNSGETGSSTVENTKSFAGKKVLVAYYSHSGNTQAVARQIARQTGGDLFAIETVQQYPSSYNALVEQAKQEIRNGFMPELKNKVPQMDQYDVVFIGSPNWWGTYAPAVKSFLSQYDFGQKNLVPFVTHGGGGMQNCESDMHRQLPRAHFLQGAAFPGRSSGADEKKLQNWLNKLAQ